MKRNIIGLLALVALLPFSRSFAQEGEIIYTEFNPPLLINSEYSLNDKIQLDVDGDGSIDVCYWMETGRYITPYLKTMDKWEARRWKINEGDTIITDTSYLWCQPLFIHDIGIDLDDGYYHFTVYEKWMFRKSDAGHYYYGWADVHFIDTAYQLSYIPYDLYRYTMSIDKMAYCTIPDYPLVWGQTSLTGVEEATEPAFVTLRPNPAKDTFTLTGAQLSEARLYSVTGQLVATKQGEGTESLTMDISGLPSGLYFVAAIGEDGSRSVLKVVKE